ncbi:facilitated trehalose transporter Tret1-like [Harmonia axyridis]|uniref:facilitated trehalose transporter Tret1-like n=1 Tax=Harmonia axyridis TaxID=115357 RepID=UPI001E2775DE|nr:facilitated trehalose transporter Tret1-like [Harmonia axyridis]
MFNNFNLRLILAVCTVNLLAFATGNVYSWSSSALITLKTPEESPLDHAVTPMEESLIASLLSLGALFGPPLAGFSSNLLGRKTTLMVFALPMVLSNLIIIFATETSHFYIARVLTGISAGGVYTVVPMYVGEISETTIRGFLAGFIGIFYSLGLLFNYVVGPLVSLQTLSIIMIVPIVLFLIFFGMFIPESPYYYFAKGRDIQAKESLMKLRNTFEEKELAFIEETLSKSKTDISISSLFGNTAFRRAITLTTTIVILQQLVGISAILAYMDDIFIASGSTISSSTSTTIVAVIQVLSVVLSSCLADKLGRRILLMVSNTLCALSLFPLGFYFYIKHNGGDVSALWYLPILCVIGFIIGYNFGLCTIPWTLLGELFTNETKAIASSVTTVSCFSFAFLFSFLFPHLKVLIGFSGVFWFCGCIGIIHLVFISIFLPETKGKSFAEILALLEGSGSEKDTYESLKMSKVTSS